VQKGQNVKNIKSKIKIKAISLVLSLLMLMPSVTGIVSATTEADALAAAGAAENTAAQTEQQAESHLEVLPDTLDISTVPEIVGTDAALAAGHIQRAYAEEKDLYTVMFKNPDGTRTAYYYNHPVKYIDTDGSVKDITLGIEANGKLAGSYVSKDTLASTLFPQRFTDGIALSGEGVSLRLAPVFNSNTGALTPITPITPITPVTPGLEADSIGTGTLTPVTVSPTAELKSDGKTVVYEYDAQTRYEYSLTYSGFKEDIIVSEYTGQTEYTFTLYTNGLTLTEDDGDFCLTDSEGNIKATLGSIIIFTADQQNNTFGSMTAETVTANEEYILTIHIDEDYLADPATLYPITIDPTIEISYANNGAGAIQDIVVNSADPLSGTDGEISAGKWGSDQSISRILMKFPHLNLNGIPYSESITSATVYIHDLMCQHEELTLECYPFIGPSWSESNATWSNTNQTGTGILGPKLSQHIISYANGLEMETSQCYGFDITAAVQGWKSGTYDQAKGIIFKASSANESATAHNYKTFASYNRANHKPYLVVEYESEIPDINIVEEYVSVLKGGAYSLSTSVTPDNATITWTSSNPYYVSVSNTGTITVNKVGSAQITASITVNGVVYSDSVIVYCVLGSGVYKINSSTAMLSIYEGAYDTEATVNNYYVGDSIFGFWKIQHIHRGQYSIRPMHNPTMILTACEDDYSVTAEDCPGTEDTMDLYATNYSWTIQEFDGLYEIKNNAIDTFNSLSVTGYDYTQIIVTYPEDNNVEYLWSLVPVQYTPRIIIYSLFDDVVISPKNASNTSSGSSIERYITREETATQQELGFRFIYSGVDSLSQTFTWQMTNNNVAASINSSTGFVTAIEEGVCVVTVRSQTGVTCSYDLHVLQFVEGKYHIRNDHVQSLGSTYSNKFLNYDNLEGLSLDQYNRYSSNQQWIVEQHNKYGAYTIKSASSGKYMCFSDSYNSIYWSSNGSGALSRWALVAKSGVSNRGYRIEPSSDSAKSVALVDNDFNIGISTSNSADVWNFFDVVIPIELIYDESIVCNDDFVDAITEAMEFVNDVYRYNFNLEFSLKLPMKQHNTECNAQHSSCVVEDSEYGSNSCIDDHHKNVFNMSDKIFQDVEIGRVYVLISNREKDVYCIGTDQDHIPNSARAAVCRGYPIVHIYQTDFYYSSTAYNRDYLKFLLVHELSHVFNMPDVYALSNYADHRPIGQFASMICFMSAINEHTYKNFIGNVEEDYSKAFCSRCKTMLQGHINDKVLDKEYGGDGLV